MSDYRILVTGSRDWADEQTIDGALQVELGEARKEGRKPVLVHGACPTGADAIADWLWMEYLGDVPERHPADWSRGRKAGPERNHQMVRSDIDVCLVFVSECSSPRCKSPGYHWSHGSMGCGSMAEGEGVQVRWFFDTDAALSRTTPERPATAPPHADAETVTSGETARDGGWSDA